MSSDEHFREKLLEANKAFSVGEWDAARDILLSLPGDNVTVTHNLAAVDYLLGKIDGEAAIKILESRPESDSATTAGFSLAYEGHETALYNLATIYSQTGHPQRAAGVLRQLLRVASLLDIAVLGRSVCLFHTLTSSGLVSGKLPRSEGDSTLEDDAMKVIVSAQDSPSSPSYAKAQEALRQFSYVSDTDSVLKWMKEEENPTPTSRAMHLNYLGASSLKERKPYVATLCFNKAREHHEETPLPHYVFNPITYNAGLSALLREEYDTAIHNFLLVQNSMKSSPLFWLRFGEAALGALQSLKRSTDRESYDQQQAYCSRLLHEGQSYGSFEYLMLPNALLTRGPYATDVVSMSDPSNKSSNSPLAAAMASMEQLTCAALQNALALLVPVGHTYATAKEAFPQHEVILSYALLYWASLEHFRRNYVAVISVSQSLLDLFNRGTPLPANLHTTLLCYLMEALVHLNEPERAMELLRGCQISHFIVGSGAGDQTDVSQRSRVEMLLVHVAITQILCGMWVQAAATMNSWLAKIFESAPAGAVEYKPESDVYFVYQLVLIFLELAQGKQSEAAAVLKKLHWSL